MELRKRLEENLMQLTRYTDYSIRTLIYLGAHEGTQTISEVAKAYGISRNHLVKVVHNLGRLGYVETLRGKSGGIRLAIPPQEINLGSVVRDVEPTLNVVECFSAEENSCPITPVCGLKGILHEASDAFFEVLEKYHLSDVIGPRKELLQLLGVLN